MSEAKKQEEEKLSVVDQKIKDLETKYRDLVKEKNETSVKLRNINEELAKLTGAFQTLQEVKAELDKDVNVVEAEDEGEKCEECPDVEEVEEKE